ncbi:MAG: PAS domain S-box protein [Candidatus Schekmanbacteria bacterium]|nr:PAS domain S-box protein [Candidatus Schekmanbacteria bacterium]
MNELFRLAVEASPVGMIVVDAHGTILFVNSEIQRLFGYREGELAGAVVDVLLPDAAKPHHAAMRAGYMRSPEQRPMGRGRDLLARRKDGSVFPVEVGLNPIRSPDGMLVMCSVLDITARKEAAERLSAANTQLERLNREKDRLLAVVSHDLRAPAATISILVDNLLVDDERRPTDLQRQLLGAIHRQVQRQIRLINDLLDHSRIESGQLTLDKQAVDLRAVLSEAIADMAGLAARFGRRLEARLGQTDICLELDEARVVNAVTNLVTNAIRFARSRVCVSLALAEEDVTVEVADDGPGVPEDELQTIFLPQQRGPSAAPVDGLGLGLAIVKGIVEAHGGRADARNVIDACGAIGGAVFRVVLPLR